MSGRSGGGRGAILRMLQEADNSTTESSSDGTKTSSQLDVGDSGLGTISRSGGRGRLLERRDDVDLGLSPWVRTPQGIFFFN